MHQSQTSINLRATNPSRASLASRNRPLTRFRPRGRLRPFFRQVVIPDVPELDPATITICTRPDGSEWCLGSGTYGKVRTSSHRRAVISHAQPLRPHHLHADAPRWVLPSYDARGCRVSHYTNSTQFAGVLVLSACAAHMLFRTARYLQHTTNAGVQGCATRRR